MTPKQLAIQETQSQCHENTTLPFVLRIALQPLASVHRSFSDYSLRWRRPDPSLVMRRHPQSEDVQLSPDKMTLEGLTSSENEDLNQKYGQHGMNTLQIALEASRSSDPQDQGFSRQLYLDAVLCLIHGLPSNLTEQETIQLTKALPNSLSGTGVPDSKKSRTHSPSLLHRGLAATIIFIFLLLRMALPYIKYVLAMAYNYERTNHLTERILTKSMNTADSFGKRCISLAGNALDNGLVMGTITYCIESICGGWNEGIAEGMKVMDAQNGP